MPKMLTVAEAALALAVSETTVRGLCARRLLRHERHGLRRGTIRIPEDALAEYREAATVALAASPRPPPVPERKLRHLSLD